MNVADRDGLIGEVPEEALEALRAQLRGQALVPGDPGYEDSRVPFNAMHADRPGLVVRSAGTADVVAAVRFARERGLVLTVRGGGHSIAGLSSSDGGMVIDLSPMRAVAVDGEARLARVQGGALLGDLDRETQVFGLATPSGGVSETGVAGLTLGGGYGWLRRKYGLSCDNLVSAEVVCADGEVRTASADVNPDLFWAIRGGGGNFGIVTTFTFQLHAVGPLVAFAGVFYPLADAAAVLRGFRDYSEAAPDEVTTEAIAITMPADPHLPEEIHDQHCLIAAGVYAGDPEKGMEVLQPLRELATPLADISQPMPFVVVQSAFDGFFPRGQLRSYWKSSYLTELPDEAIDVIAERAAMRPAVGSPVESFYLDLLPMGGAVNRVGGDESAFGERSAPYVLNVGANWTDAADDAANIAWTRATWSEFGRFASGSTYLNFTGRADEPVDARVADSFGPNLQRLAQVKAIYDPENVFRRNNNILPAA